MLKNVFEKLNAGTQVPPDNGICIVDRPDASRTNPWPYQETMNRVLSEDGRKALLARALDDLYDDANTDSMLAGESPTVPVDTLTRSNNAY